MSRPAALQPAFSISGTMCPKPFISMGVTMVPKWQTSELAERTKITVRAEVKQLCSLARNDSARESPCETLQNLRQFYMDSFEPGACALIFEKNAHPNALGITQLARELQVMAFALSQRFEVSTDDVLAWLQALYQAAFKEQVMPALS